MPVRQSGRHALQRSTKLRNITSAVLTAALSIPTLFLQANPATAAIITSEVVNVDFTTTVPSGTTITNTAAGSLANLTISGSPTFDGTTGATFPNTTASSTMNYLKGNLGPTTDMSKITVEFTAKFEDTGCAAQLGGSMVFGLGTNNTSFAYYNIYRHSNFIGFNTFTSDIYGVSVPDNTSFHSYKFVMLPSPANANTLQEIWIDGVKQSPSYKTTSVAVSPCSVIAGAGETAAERKFTRGSYDNGDFMFMTHPVNANAWGTTGLVKSLKITTIASVVAAGAPTLGSITVGNAQLSVPFTAPSSNGGGVITNYKYSTDNGSTWVSAASTTSPIVIAGLTNGTAYNVKLLAVNSAGDGTASAGASATPFAPITVPGAPTMDSVTAGNAQLSVAFTDPASDGGASITDYKYSTDNGSTWTSAVSRVSPIVITGLTNGTAYTIKLRAVNSVGDGTASAGVAGTPALPQSTNSGSSSGSGSAAQPVAPPAKVESIAVTKAVGANGSLVKVVLDPKSAQGSGSTVKVRLLNSKGELIQELNIPITSSTSVLELPLSLAVGDFTVEAMGVNSSGTSQTVASQTSYIPKVYFRPSAAYKTPVLSGVKLGNPIYFAPNSFKLSAQSKKALLEIVAITKSTNSRIALTGFTASFNQGTAVEKRLATLRALQVAKYLKTNGATNWIYYAGFGAVKGNKNPATLRKVELRIIK